MTRTVMLNKKEALKSFIKPNLLGEGECRKIRASRRDFYKRIT